MRKFKLMFCYFSVLALAFTSCSKDETNPTDNSEKATLSFSAIVNDLASKSSNKQSSASDIPECSDAQPAYATVVLSQNGMPVVGTMEAPFRVDLVAGQVFTEETPELELEPGEYSLDHFMVYDADGNLIWVAPAGGTMADFVDAPLPMDISLGAGVKKYVDVSVLCYDDRNVNEYGYLFFDLDTNEGIEFCIFGNYCDETGRHYPAEYSVDVWRYENGTRGSQIYNDHGNNVSLDGNGDYATAPLCFILPDTEGMDEYYFEITLEDSDAYGDVQNRVIRSGVINDDEVRSFFDGDNNLEYYHFRTGCEGEDSVPVFQDPESDAIFYKAIVSELNDSNAKGLAYLKLEDNRLYTTVLASGMEANMLHPQHIHGFEDDSNSVCPPSSADEDGNGFVTLGEGAPFYGPVLLPLTQNDGSFPTANSVGTYTYSQSFTLGEGETISADGIDPLENRVIVLHGMTADLDPNDDQAAEYVATLPVACGQIQEITPFSL
ncbi:hypothetical protein SAMN04488034_103102 [Salinimicrobium catena]|uniref:Uncharacterized protein n=1 Tax=Salinimicrobium catena TaxID=390640 RepID=A0A1H5MTM1_9FLAO|nr:hypothetical protein [Salinimicrobium catena]SDL29504.1 hypothetical protein SAMN04488140_103102 [Salinimicrobium catena]SEE92709.1 hypothetical protein SAMN04488034_103102 [Salinimicrobium catena]